MRYEFDNSTLGNTLRAAADGEETFLVRARSSNSDEGDCKEEIRALPWLPVAPTIRILRVIVVLQRV